VTRYFVVIIFAFFEIAEKVSTRRQWIIPVTGQKESFLRLGEKQRITSRHVVTIHHEHKVANNTHYTTTILRNLENHEVFINRFE
jgi:hypothetical protein